MKITKNSFLIPIIIFSVLIAIVVFSLKNIITFNHNSNWVIHSYKVKLALANNISLLKDIETGERGFILTGNKDFKEYSDLTIPEIQKNIFHLQNLITDKNQLVNLDSLKLLIEKKIAISNEIINIREQHGLNAAEEKVGSLKGKLIMDDIRDLSKNVEVLAEELLTDRIEDSYGSFLFAKIFVLVGGILAILIAIFLMIINNKSLKLKTRLLKSEAKFKQVLESAPDGIVVIGNNRKIQMVNAQTENLFGYTKDEMIGKEVQMLMPDRFREGHPAYERKFITDQKARVMGVGKELFGKRKDGSEFAIEISLTPLQLGDEKEGGIVLATIRDITERKKTERKIIASQAYTRSLIEASLDPLVTICPEGKITDVNEALAKVTGETREKLIGTDFSDYFTEPEKAREGYKQVFDKGFVSDYPLTIQHTTGKLIEVIYNASVYKDDKGNVLGVFAAARDVTNKKAEELIIANKELAFQNEEKEKRADELIIANKELVFQNEEKEKRADELIIANKELAFQNEEKEKRADELIIANKELAFQNEEKEKRADELIIANKELAFQNEEKEKRADELIIADLEIIVQNKEKEKREIAANELKAFNLSMQRDSLYARSLIEAATDPLVTISPEGKITDVNEASVKVTGVSRDKLIGTDFSDYFTEPEKAREGYKKVFDKGFVSDYPLTIHHATGKLTDVLYNASVYKDGKGSVLGVFAAARDVTAQKKLERDVANREKELGRLIELERFRKLTVGRELKMIELKKENEELRGKLGMAKDENS